MSVFVPRTWQVLPGIKGIFLARRPTSDPNSVENGARLQASTRRSKKHRLPRWRGAHLPQRWSSVGPSGGHRRKHHTVKNWRYGLANPFFHLSRGGDQNLCARRWRLSRDTIAYYFPRLLSETPRQGGQQTNTGTLLDNSLTSARTVPTREVFFGREGRYLFWIVRVHEGGTWVKYCEGGTSHLRITFGFYWPAQ